MAVAKPTSSVHLNMSDSIAARVTTLIGDGYHIAKILNYDEDDFMKIINCLRSHHDDIEFKVMTTITHLPFGGGRSFTLIGMKPNQGNDEQVFELNDFSPGQQVNLNKWFNCEPVEDSDDSIQNSNNPTIKHCPLNGGSATPVAAICFDKVHNTMQSAEVAFELMVQIKRACKQSGKLKKIGEDGKWLDVRYNRTSGYTLHVLSEHFSMLMLAVKGFDVKELSVDAKMGSFSRLSCDAAKTHYAKMIKSGSGEESKAVMLGLPLKISEQEVGTAVLKIYNNITSLSDEDCKMYGIPAGLPAVKETDFDIQTKDGTFPSGDPYRMAYITLPDPRIFDYDEAFRTSNIFNDRGKASVLQKKISKKQNEKHNEEKNSSLGVERKIMDEASIGEGQVDFTAEEASFGQAGTASTPQAFQRDSLAHEQINTLQKQIDTLTKNKMEALSQEDIQEMITCGQVASTKATDGKISSMNDQLVQINDAYNSLVKIETERMQTFREAVKNLKEAILNTKIPESQKEAMFKKVNEMKASMSQEAKEEMKAMMDSVMETTHQLAVGAAAEQVELMAKVVENNMTQSAEAREGTAESIILVCR